MNYKVLLTLALVASVVLNAVLLGRKPATPEAAAARVAAPAASSTRTLVLTNFLEKSIDWRHVESDDYKKYIANLRAIGCPEETIKDIILADVNKLFDARRKALKPPGERFEFWKSGSKATRGPDEERMKQLQALAKEKRDLLRELLGVDVIDPQDALAALTSQISEMLGFLPPERQTQLIELEQRYAARMAKLSGQTNEAAVASLRAIQAEKEAELNQLLSPAERETYDLTTSRTASVMRSQLGDFDPNEQEFRDIYQARKKLDEETRRFGDPKDPASAAGRESALLQAYNEIHQALGDERWNEYRSAREWTANSPLRQIAEAEGISKSEAMKVPDLRDAYRREMLRLNANSALSPEQRQQAARQAQAMTITEITRILGAKAAAAYLANPSTKIWVDGLATARNP